MKNFDVKLKRIFVPFLIISAGTIITYSFLRWLLFIKYNLFVVDQDILDFWAPLFFVLVPILIWLGPRVKLMDLTPGTGTRSDPFAGFMILAMMAIGGPTIVAQVYVESATGKLTHLGRISQIDSVAQTKFYSVKTFYADKRLARFKPRFVIRNKSSDFDMYIYAVVPVYNLNHTTKTYNYSIGAKDNVNSANNALIVINGKPSSRDTLRSINPHAIKNVRILKGNLAKRLYGENAEKGAILIETVPFSGPDTMQVISDDNGNYKSPAWLAMRYLKTVSNHLSADEKNTAYQQFAKETQIDFNAKPLDKFIYLDRVPDGDDWKQYLAAVNSEDSPVPAPKNLLTPVYEPFDRRNGNKLLWIFGAFGIGSVLFALMLLIKPLRIDVAAAVDRPDKTQQAIDEIISKNSRESEN